MKFLCRFLISPFGLALILFSLATELCLRVIKPHMRFLAFVAVFAVLHTCSWSLVWAYAANVSVPTAEAQGQNPNSSLPLDEDGTPVDAQGSYYPAEMNPLLGKASFLTPLECVKRYGEKFCSCGKLDDGTQYCYYNRPAAGYYTSMESCESVWGGGHCICSAPDKCRLYEPTDQGKSLQCLGQIYFFSGEKMECRKSGIMSMGTDCCKSEQPESEECSFENVAKKMGMDDLAITAVSIGTKLADLGGYSLTDYLAQQVAATIVETAIKEGSMSTIVSSATSLLGGAGADLSMEVLNSALADAALEGATLVMEGAVAQAAVTAVATAISSFITIAGWVYFAYQCYNIVKEMQKCSAGEYMLGCKVAKGICHKVGNRCKVKVMGGCLQSMGVYCCFSTKLAKIINEQGRPQIDKSWGSAQKPKCEGFLMDEFAQIDFSKMDLAEYTEDLVREMNPNIANKIKDATENLNKNFQVNP